MSNVFSNTDFAVLSVMQNKLANGFIGATAFVQRKPEADYGNILTVSFASSDYAEEYFNVQARFDANIAPNIMQQITTYEQGPTPLVSSNSNISAKSYAMSATEIK